MQLSHISVFILISGLLWSCTVMSPSVKDEALPTIAFKVLIEDVKKYQGETVILGGYVISVENKSDHTRIEAVQSPLGAGEKPKAKDHSQGRLIIIYKGFIDPEVYTKDRQITVGGKILDSSATQQQAPYPYLRLEVTEIHLWPVITPSPASYWDDGYPYHYPWWWHPYWHHHH